MQIAKESVGPTSSTISCNRCWSIVFTTQSTYIHYLQQACLTCEGLAIFSVPGQAVSNCRPDHAQLPSASPSSWSCISTTAPAPKHADKSSMTCAHTQTMIRLRTIDAQAAAKLLVELFAYRSHSPAPAVAAGFSRTPSRTFSRAARSFANFGQWVWALKQLRKQLAHDGVALIERPRITRKSPLLCEGRGGRTDGWRRV